MGRRANQLVRIAERRDDSTFKTHPDALQLHGKHEIERRVGVVIPNVSLQLVLVKLLSDISSYFIILREFIPQVQIGREATARSM